MFEVLVRYQSILNCTTKELHSNPPSPSITTLSSNLNHYIYNGMCLKTYLNIFEPYTLLNCKQKRLVRLKTNSQAFTNCQPHLKCLFCRLIKYLVFHSIKSVISCYKESSLHFIDSCLRIAAVFI